MISDLATVAGVPETKLTEQILAQLPEQAPPAPWRAGLRAITWWGRLDRAAAHAAREALPSALRDATPLIGVGMLVSYTHTPVGPYDEAIGMLVLRRGREIFTHVPFIAVSSPASVVGGRANWALPKTLATFDGHPTEHTTMTAQGGGWKVSATAAPRGPLLPLLLPPLADLVQVDDGHLVCAPVSAHGRGRLARVTVDITSDGQLATWLPQGQRTGLLSPSITGYLPPTR